LLSKIQKNKKNQNLQKKKEEKRRKGKVEGLVYTEFPRGGNFTIKEGGDLISFLLPCAHSAEEPLPGSNTIF